MLISGHITNTNYPVWIEAGAGNKILNYAPRINKNCRVAVVTDREVQALHMKTFREQFECQNIQLNLIIVDGTEAGKNLDSVKTVYDHLNDLSWTTEDILIAFGGGSVLDITAFAAATYIGGVGFWQVPTTLLSMIDSSVSLSCHLNFRSSKDMISLKSCPQGVIIDPDYLKSLAPKQLANGYASVIMYGYLQSPDLINMLESDDFNTGDLIAKSIACKLDLINRDPFLLSFGQPVSDAIEGHFRFLKYLHGEASALGMLASSYSGRLCDLLHKYGLPTFIEGVNPDTLIKKASRICGLQGNSYRMVKVKEPGQISIETIDSNDSEAVLAEMISSISAK